MSVIAPVNQQMIDAAEAAGAVVGVVDNSVPVGLCLMFRKGTLIYQGPLAGRPNAAAGTMVVMNKVDFDLVEAAIRKKLH